MPYLQLNTVPHIHLTIFFYINNYILKLASKTPCDESALLNMTPHNDMHIKNLEDSLTFAMKSKNEMVFEVYKSYPVEFADFKANFCVSF